MISSLLSESFRHPLVLGFDRLDFCLESLESQDVLVAILPFTVFHILNQVIVLGLSRVYLVKKGLDAQFIFGLASLIILLIHHHFHQVSVLSLARVNSVQESIKIGFFLFLLIFLFHLL